MPLQVVNGAVLQCTFGTTPATFSVLPVNRVRVDGQPAANVQDFIPMVNIPSFTMCMSLSNPQVAAATTAALGVLTPQPCIPVTTAPWTPGAAVTRIAGQLALDNVSTCACQWGGVISVTDAGQATHEIP
jgi:hypothetical protein